MYLSAGDIARSRDQQDARQEEASTFAAVLVWYRDLPAEYCNAWYGSVIAPCSARFRCSRRICYFMLASSMRCGQCQDSISKQRPCGVSNSSTPSCWPHMLSSYSDTWCCQCLHWYLVVWNLTTGTLAIDSCIFILCISLESEWPGCIHVNCKLYSMI